jgi:hypothetical protein
LRSGRFAAGVVPGFAGDATGETDGLATGLAAGLTVATGDGVVLTGLFGA